MEGRIGGNTIVNQSDVSAWKRGHPPLPVTEVFLECRGLSRQSVDASRLKTKVELKGLASWLHWLEHVFNDNYLGIKKIKREWFCLTPLDCRV
ncbi:uncharacterized protein LOC141678258 isoform X3 [Apium graveolens]|uniref:uncharacterized protein LOC141678258 isoform X3 n=1 Tax=Apium graveolens TaxID=4045 RepID=UPI003D7B11BA